MPKSLVHFNHDTRPLKTRLGNPASSTNWASRVFFFYNITCHRLKQWSLIESTRGEPGSKTKCRWDHCLDRWGLVCRRGRITQAGFQRSCVVVWMYKALLKTNCRLASVRPDCLANDMKWNEQGHIGLDSALDLWLIGHFKLRFFASRIGHPKLECIALSFLLEWLEWKLGVKGNRLNLKGSGK